MNVWDRLKERQAKNPETLTRLDRLVLSSTLPDAERLQLAAELHNLKAAAEGRELITVIDDLSALMRLEVNE